MCTVYNEKKIKTLHGRAYFKRWIFFSAHGNVKKTLKVPYTQQPECPKQPKLENLIRNVAQNISVYYTVIKIFLGTFSRDLETRVYSSHVSRVKVLAKTFPEN